ncbi:MAG: DUF2239 family protein [Gemmatimonadota bacterium]|nr:MAG: DUF2239 family protein [Gemmatimonadota bacterium]
MMDRPDGIARYTAFSGDRRIASGPLDEVAGAVKSAVDGCASEVVLIFDDRTSRLVELDMRGTFEEVLERLGGGSVGGGLAMEPATAQDQPRRGPGRPRLGVVGREVTLLPRHWAWLEAQRGNASATLRRLVDQARRDTEEADAVRGAQDAAHRFCTAMAGDRPGFEEAMRALFARDRDRFHAETDPWPADVREHARCVAADAFGGVSPGLANRPG